MGWAVGNDGGRDIGYGVPAICDHPGCGAAIDRGLGHVCGYGEPYGGDFGCGRYFCAKHGGGQLCVQCRAGEAPFDPTPDTAEWVRHKLTDDSWAAWRAANPEWVAAHSQPEFNHPR